MANNLSNNAGNEMNSEISLQVGIAEVTDVTVSENEPVESILGGDKGSDTKCNIIVKNIPDAAVCATICDEEYDDDFIIVESQKKREKVTKSRLIGPRRGV